MAVLVVGPDMGGWAGPSQGCGATKQMAFCVPALGGEGRVGRAASVSPGQEEHPAWVRATPGLGEDPGME